MKYPVIIIPAFNRAGSLERLLDSISLAYFPKEDIKIIISLDGEYTEDVYRVATKFSTTFSYADVEVIARSKNLGLREHILLCGDFSILYGSCIILEDDLIVSKNFYTFACQAADRYDVEHDIAGIALYAQRYNEYSNLPFEPNTNRESDVFFMQVACSWGQVWTEKQWVSFKKWYNKNIEIDLLNFPCIPKSVAMWPKSSWKKYYSAYLILNNKYFVYPYISFTSNCADSGGTHNLHEFNTVQVPLNHSETHVPSFLLPKLDDNSITYDGFMEYKLTPNRIIFGINSSEIQIDLYGTKPLSLLMNSEYSISSKKNTHPLVGFPLRFKSIENNLYYLLDNSDNSFFSLNKSSNFITETAHTKRIRDFKLLNYFNYSQIINKSFLYGLFCTYLNKIFKCGIDK